MDGGCPKNPMVRRHLFCVSSTDVCFLLLSRRNAESDVVVCCWTWNDVSCATRESTRDIVQTGASAAVRNTCGQKQTICTQPKWPCCVSPSSFWSFWNRSVAQKSSMEGGTVWYWLAESLEIYAPTMCLPVCFPRRRWTDTCVMTVFDECFTVFCWLWLYFLLADLRFRISIRDPCRALRGKFNSTKPCSRLILPKSISLLFHGCSWILASSCCTKHSAHIPQLTNPSRCFW